MNEKELLIYINEKGESITFGVGSPFHVNVQKDVTGISDLQNTIYSTSSMGQHGDTFTSVRIESRDIIIKGKITELEKGAQLDRRRQAMKILNPEVGGYLHYVYGDFKRKIGAMVDGSPKFTHPDQAQEFQINFKCLNPFWEEEQEAKEDIASWIGDWEFPTEIIEGSQTSMEFGHREESVIVDIFNAGHVSTGMKIVFRALGELTGPLLFNVNTREFMKINYTMQAGDTITVNTEYGKKTAVLRHQGIDSNIYRFIDVDSTFIQLDTGDNIFRYDAASGLENLECTIYFSAKYLGV